MEYTHERMPLNKYEVLCDASVRVEKKEDKRKIWEGLCDEANE